MIKKNTIKCYLYAEYKCNTIISYSVKEYKKMLLLGFLLLKQMNVFPMINDANILC